MKTPVIIPAYNEELRLGATLGALPEQHVEQRYSERGPQGATSFNARETE